MMLEDDEVDINTENKKNMSAYYLSTPPVFNLQLSTDSSATPSRFPQICPSFSKRFHLCHCQRKPYLTTVSSKSSGTEELSSSPEDEWLSKLRDKKKPLYSHSLPCLEAWLKSVGFFQTEDDPAVWLIQKPDWHAQLLLDITDLYIGYLKSDAGILEKDVERRFSYALSREDIENAIPGGP